VRELSHLMERATLFHPEPVLDTSVLERLCLPSFTARVVEGTAPPLGHEESGDEPTRIREALMRTAGNVVRAERLLGLRRDALRYRMWRYGIVPQKLEDRAAAPAVHSTMKAEDVSPAGARAWDAAAMAEHTPTASPPAEAGEQASSWERKPVAVLAIDIIWPETTAPETPPYEPWTLAARWEQAIVEKVQGFGGVVLQHSPSLLLAGFGIPQTLEQQAQRAVHAALAMRHLVAGEGSLKWHGPLPSVRLALH
jgi:class 3 adenylate cyclase